MEPHQPRTASHPHMQGLQPLHPSQVPSRTASSTPVSSPGLFSPTVSRLHMALQHPAPDSAASATAAATASSPYLHPLQTRKVRETYTANVDRDFTTGRKHINQYEVIEEIGRGQHGKVKLARNTKSGENVAIKIIPRYSKRRRLGKVTAEDPQRNTKREIAILKKIRHANVVALLEVIDDPELKKIYMVLEHVENGEITWRKKGLPRICDLERRMVEKGARGESTAAEEAELWAMQRRRAKYKAAARSQKETSDYWSLEYGGAFEDDDADFSPPESRVTSHAPSRTQSAKSLSKGPAPHPTDSVPAPRLGDSDADVPSSLEGTMYGAYVDDHAAPSTLRARSPSMADSIMSHMSSVDFAAPPHDPFADDFSYVPCFTIDNARSAFRDTVLGLEYLHYNGVVHRDIKPANLLWTKDFRVKISDFGVSYFGRPIREGEPDEPVSESEALDFDDDRELSKTVGTPAFFAPELCYTDFDKPPPKVSEQIDVWSLGVTLYCIIFARIPFLCEDEFSMFRKIATEDAYIPRRRLRPVFPFTDPSKTSLYKRVNSEPYRDDDDPVYEDIDDDLYDLLRRMLTRDPEKRIRLREVKSHPWVVRGVSNAWLDETDPSRRMSGKPIEVDEKEIGRAVIPLTFLERAKSTLKKAVGKVIHPRGDRAESASRRRAGSSVASSAGDSASNPPSAYPRDIRRKSIRPDDYFATVTQMPNEHPLSQSVTASPQESSPQEFDPPLSMSLGREPSKHTRELRLSDHPGLNDMQPSSHPKPQTRHSHAHSIGSSFVNLTPGLQEFRIARTVPSSPGIAGITGGTDDNMRSSHRNGREASISSDDSSRARSMDRAGLVFPHVDKHADAMVALSTAVAPGNVQQPLRSPRHIRSIDLLGTKERASNSLALVPGLSSGCQIVHPNSDPGLAEKHWPGVGQGGRPSTALRVEASTPEPATEPSTTPNATDCGVPAETAERLEDSSQRHRLTMHTAEEDEAACVPCPPSPSPADDSLSHEEPLPPSREETMSTAVSSSVTSFGAIATPMTSPSVVTSPLCTNTPGISQDKADAMPAYHSDPSLPALMSGASSVSADIEGDFLGNPGVVDRSSLITTTDSLTPPAPVKETLTEFPLEQADSDGTDAIAVRIDSTPSVGSGQAPRPHPPSQPARSPSGDGYDNDSDSDEGLTMAPKRKPVARNSYVPTGSFALAARRRDTNTSIGSTETAKKVDVNGERLAG